jgi:hypothetical protein
VLFFLFTSVGRPGRPAAPGPGYEEAEAPRRRRRKYTLTVKPDGTLTWQQGDRGEKRLVKGATRIVVETTAPPARVAKAVQNVKNRARFTERDELHDVIVALVIAEVI